MALSGVRNSWLMLARNCDLCWLATSSWRPLSWISSKRRTFSMAIAAWSAKVVTSSICLSVNGRTCERQGKDADWDAFAQHWDAKNCAEVAQSRRFDQGVFRISLYVGNMNHPTLS